MYASALAGVMNAPLQRHQEERWMPPGKSVAGRSISDTPPDRILIRAVPLFFCCPALVHLHNYESER